MTEPSVSQKRQREMSDCSTASKKHNTSILAVQKDKLEDLPFPSFQKPKQVASFSALENTCEVHPNLEKTNKTAVNNYLVPSNQCCLPRIISENRLLNKAVLCEPQSLEHLGFDLTVGYGTQVAKQDKDQYINVLLLSLIKENLLHDADVICWRGLLTKIAASPYDIGKFDDGLMLVAQRVGKTIYLCEFPTKSAVRKQSEQTEKQKQMSYWGMKFESYVTSCDKQKQPTPTQPMNFNREYAVVVSTKLQGHKLTFAGEVDCSLPDQDDQYVELKTTREFDHGGHEASFRKFKILKWWLQSFLIGIGDILCGFRDDAGIVHRCEWYSVNNLPRLARQDRDSWKPNACLNFLDQFLTFVKSQVIDELVPYVFTRTAHGREFTVRKDSQGQYKFLPSWLVDADSVATTPSPV